MALPVGSEPGWERTARGARPAGARLTEQPAGAGSVLLLPEVLGQLLRDGDSAEVRILAGLLARLELRPIDRATADLATALASKYGLRAADATHLATAVGLGAERFNTNNKRDFPQAITEVKVTYPADLADAEVS